MSDKISRLHYITQEIPGMSHSDLVLNACKGGIEWIQLRIKDKESHEILSIAESVLKICRAHNAKLIINDHVKIAFEIGADGIHLGREDMQVDEARKILGKDFIIGGTANTLDHIKDLENQKADYIGLGPFRFTQTKKNLSPVLGFEGIRNLSAITSIPVIAIGGIVQNDLEILFETDIHGIAVSSSINNAPVISRAAKEFIEQIKKLKNGKIEAGE